MEHTTRSAEQGTAISFAGERTNSRSASAPVVAAVVSQVNAARLRNGQSRLGFLNPFLYSQGLDGLTDIVHGTSTGCAGTIESAGWEAVKGWDAVTGLGTLFYPSLVKAATGGW